jgi:sortase A
MTIAPPSETQVAPAVELEAPEPAPVGIDGELLRRRALQILIVVLLVALATVFFETLVTKKYYQVRQSQLFSSWLQPRPRLLTGGAASILQIPRTTGSNSSTALNLDVVVVQGDNATQLYSGPGHVPGTPLPGRRGNSIIVGHADGWGGPFGALATVRKGALILTQTHGSRSVTVYTVTAVKHISATNRFYTAPSRDFRLTLITSAGGLLSNDRVVVQAVSGKALPVRRRGPVVTIPHPTLWLNPAVAVALGALVFAGIAASYMRRRFGLLARLAVLIPLVTVGVFAALLDLSLLLPPLR